jgi:hypothetical protein
VPVNQANLNSMANERYPIIWEDELYFSSDRGHPNAFDVYHARWNAVAGAYAESVIVAELSTDSSEDPVGISPDGLMLFLTSNRSGTLGQDDLWVSTRPSTAAAWGTPINLAALNSNAYDWGMNLAPDLSFALFASGRPTPAGGRNHIWLTDVIPGGGWETPVLADIRAPATMDIWTAHILSNGSLLAEVDDGSGQRDIYLIPPREPDPPSKFQWGTPVAISELNSPTACDVHATMTADQLMLCFSSDRSGGAGNYDLWCATRASVTDPFGPPKNQTALNAIGNDTNPGLRSDGTELFFASDRSGNTDLYRAVWVPADNAFELPEPVTELNTSADESGPSLTSGDLTLLFDSTRSGGAGSFDIYLAVRPDRSSPFGTPIRLADLNTTWLDGEPAADLEGYKVVFSSQRPRPSESGQQTWRLWAAELNNGQWSTPEFVTFDNFQANSNSGPTILSDDSLLFHSDASGVCDLYIAPPK